MDQLKQVTTCIDFTALGGYCRFGCELTDCDSPSLLATQAGEFVSAFSHNRWRWIISALTPVMLRAPFGQPMQSLFSTSSAIAILEAPLPGRLKSSEKGLCSRMIFAINPAIEVTGINIRPQSTFSTAEGSPVNPVEKPTLYYYHDMVAPSIF